MTNENAMMTSCGKMKMMVQAASEGDHNVIHKVIQSATPGLRLKKTMSQALVKAASKGHVLVIRELLGAGCELDDYYDGKTALLAAAESGHEQIVKELHLAGADLEAQVIQDGSMNKSTALILAAAHDHKKTVHYLLDAGANIEARNNLGETAIIVASRLGCQNVVKFLGRHADLEAADKNKKTALLKAIQQNNITIVKCLHSAGANINRMEHFPLMYAIDKEYLEIVNYLAQYTIHLDAIDSDGHTALVKAAILGNLEIMECLITAGANINKAPICRNRSGGTTLTEAVRYRRISAIEMLIARGANIDLHLVYTLFIRRFCRQNCVRRFWRCKHDTCEDSLRFLIAAGGEAEACTRYNTPYQLPLTYTEVINEVAELVPEIKEDSLQSRCRERVRCQLRRYHHKEPLYTSVKKLGLPEPMQKYLLFNVDVEEILYK